MSAGPRTPSDPCDTEILDDRYRLGDRIGRGAFADVIEATHVFTGHRFAIKRWRLRTDNAEDAARWKREILAHTSIMHPAAVAISDAGLDGRGRPYTVMERLDGEDLQERLTRGPLSLDEALDVFEQLLDGLAAAHGAGIGHRDLKPANVFLERTASGPARVRLLDFGFALPLNREVTRITSEGFAVGTVHYMAPEQTSAHDNIGAAADVWAIGVMLYEALAGVRPFVDPTIDGLVASIRRGVIVPVVRHAPHVPDIVGAIIAKCLSVRTELRYPSAAVLREAWAAVRATRSAWGLSSVDDGEPATRALWTATGQPSPAWMRPARPSPMPIIPVTRPTHGSAGKTTAAPAPPARIEGMVPAGLEPSGESAALDQGPADASPGTGRSRWTTPVRWCAGALLILSVALFGGRDWLFVPLLSGDPDYVGYMLQDARWTPVVNLGAAVAFALAALLGVVGVVLARFARTGIR